MALAQRRPESVIHHSDQGCQYSIEFGSRLMGVRPAMGSIGDCYDNAMCESFFATLECEVLDCRLMAFMVRAIDVSATKRRTDLPADIGGLPRA